MLFDEPTMSLDPIVALQVMDLVIRARDIHQISSIYVTKKPMEIPYFANYVARRKAGGIIVEEAEAAERADTSIIVLESARIVLNGSVESFQSSELESVKRMLTLEQDTNESEIYFQDPWAKSRVAHERLL
jgi:ABC-type multidrug transport system ATPase subunit